MWIQVNFIALEIIMQSFSSQHLRYFNELVVVVLSLEEGLSLEHHPCEHAAQAPNVKCVVVCLMINQQLWSFEVARGHSHIILLIGMVELSETPVDQPHLPLRMIYHNIMGLHVSVNYALRVAEIQRLQNFVHIESDIKVSELFVKSTEVVLPCLHILHDLW